MNAMTLNTARFVMGLFVSLAICDQAVAQMAPCPYKYSDGRPCGGKSGLFGTAPCTNPRCPGNLGSSTPSKPDSGIVGIGNFEIDIRTLDRWNSMFGETIEQYLGAACKVHPELGGKKIRIGLGPSNEIEFFTGDQSVTHLIWPEIEKIRKEKISRVPVVAGIYNASNVESGRMQIEQKGRTATISSNLLNGGLATFRGEYQQVTLSDGSKTMGFWGDVTVTNADGTSFVSRMLIRVVLNDPPRVEVEDWFNQPDGKVIHRKTSNHASEDERGKIIAGPRF